jgi:hypothetical protein
MAVLSFEPAIRESVDEPSKGFRYSSARRPGRGPSLAILAAAAVVVVLVLLAVFHRAPEPQVELRPALIPISASPPPPTATPTVIPTATSIVEFASDWVDVSRPADTPTPWPTIPPSVRREPTPTPRVSECVSYRWSTVQAFIPSAQVLTEIRVDNNCNRDLVPTNLVFEISGWRNGGLIRSVRAMPFDRIGRRHSDIISVGLPGSLDWYDEITVEIVD